MISSWICWVPSKMSRIFASRAHFSSSSSSLEPQGAAEGNAAQGDVDGDPAGLRLRIGRVQRVRLPVVGHPGRLHRQQAGGLVLGLQLEQLGRRRALRVGGAVRIDLDAGVREQLGRSLEAGPGDPAGHRGDERPRAVERPHRAAEALLHVDLGAAEQVPLGDPAVVEDEGGRVGCTDAELVLEPVELQTRVGALDHERLDRRPAELRIEARPDDDEIGSFAGGHVDLLAVEHVLVAVEDRRGPDRRRVGARLRLGDRHRGPFALEPRLLFVIGNRRNGGVAESLPGHRQQQADIPPAHLHDRKHRSQVRAVAVPAVAVALRLAGAGRPGSAGRSTFVEPVDQRREHVELLRILVLGEVVLPRDRPQDLERHRVGLLDQRLELLRYLEIDHQTSRPPSMTPAARRSRYQRSTGYSLT